MASWQRFEKWLRNRSGELVDVERTVELAVDEAAYFERSISDRDGTKLTTRRLASAELAEAHLDRRIQALRNQGWIYDGAVERPIPKPAPAKKARRTGEGSPAWRKIDRERRALFEERLRSAGIDPAMSFFAQAGPSDDADELAERCIEIAERVLGVVFARAGYDPEHDSDGWPIPSDQLAAFYASPARVFSIAREHFLGKRSGSDGRFPSA
jgi:hypothetical protein